MQEEILYYILPTQDKLMPTELTVRYGIEIKVLRTHLNTWQSEISLLNNWKWQLFE